MVLVLGCPALLLKLVLVVLLAVLVPVISGRLGGVGVRMAQC